MSSDGKKWVGLTLDTGLSYTLLCSSAHYYDNNNGSVKMLCCNHYSFH